MSRLVAVLEELRGKLDRFRKEGLKETPTRTIFIDPILEALGWDVRDPDEVQLEYPTVDGKSVDYAMKSIENTVASDWQLAAAKAPHDKSVLQAEIEAAEREIDRLVYELYGLTEQEIKIVEGAPG